MSSTPQQLHWFNLDTYGKADAVRAELENAGGSAGDVGKRLGVTRNAIISVAKRHGIRLLGPKIGANMQVESNRKERARQKDAAARLAAANAARALAPAPEHVPEDAPGKPLMQLAAGDCRWPLFEVLPLLASTARFCGVACVEGSRWCPEHRAVATRPQPVKVKRERSRR